MEKDNLNGDQFDTKVNLDDDFSSTTDFSQQQTTQEAKEPYQPYQARPNYNPQQPYPTQPNSNPQQPYQAQPNYNQQQQQPYQPTQNDIYMKMLSDKIGKKQDYFMQEFAKVEGGHKSKFNKPAFFFAPLYCIHRKNIAMSMKVVPIYLIANILVVMMLWIEALNPGNMAISTAALAVNCLLAILSIATAIYSGINFNKTYYKQLKEEIIHPEKTSSNKKALTIASILFVAMIAVQFITPDTFYSTFDFNDGSLQNSVYTNESMGIAFEADSNWFIGDQDDYISMIDGDPSGVQFFIRSSSGSIYAEFFNVVQNYKYISTDDYMSNLNLWSYGLYCDSSDYALVENYTIGDIEFQLYEMTYTNDSVTYNDYFLITSANYNIATFIMQETDLETFYSIIDNFYAIDVVLDSSTQEDSEEDSDVADDTDVAEDTQLAAFENGSIENSVYTNESLGFVFTPSDDLYVGDADAYWELYEETSITMEFFAYNLAQTQYLEFYFTELPVGLTNDEYMDYTCSVYETSVDSIYLKEYSEVEIGGCIFDSYYIYYEYESYYYESYFFVKEVDGGRIVILAQGYDYDYVQSLLDCFEVIG